MINETWLIYLLICICLLVVCFILIAKNILTIFLLTNLFSLLSVLFYALLDAPDVAMTEAAVGFISFIFAIYSIRLCYHTSNYVIKEKFSPILFIILGICAACLIYASFDLPIVNPNIHNEYLKKMPQDIGIASLVTSILASYRGYDTFLETLVVLVGCLAIYLLKNEQVVKKFYNIESDKIAQTITKIIFPLILMFALYILWHGEVSPGGGFQAGAVMANGFIIYMMVFGSSKIIEFISIKKLIWVAVIGEGLYFMVGLVGLLAKMEFFNYNLPYIDNKVAQKISITFIEIAVAITVSAVMLLIFMSFANASNKSKL